MEIIGVSYRLGATLLVLGAIACRASDDTAASATWTGGDHVHFLIPGAPGGGWDGTARGVGEALVRSGLVSSVSYENLSGGGGGRALAHFIATADRQQRTLLVSSTPIVIASLRGRLPRSWRDTTPVASVIGDYLTFAARADSDFRSWSDPMAEYRRDPAAVKIAGGSVLGGMDHLVASLALDAAGADPRELRYVPYDTGGKAKAALYAGETLLAATGLGEILDARRGGLVRLLAVTARERLPEAPDVPTLSELGAPVEFVNWRGFFAPPAPRASAPTPGRRCSTLPSGKRCGGATDGSRSSTPESTSSGSWRTRSAISVN